jgi:hypothetical protein
VEDHTEGEGDEQSLEQGHLMPQKVLKIKVAMEEFMNQSVPFA